MALSAALLLAFSGETMCQCILESPTFSLMAAKQCSFTWMYHHTLHPSPAGRDPVSSVFLFFVFFSYYIQQSNE